MSEATLLAGRRGHAEDLRHADRSPISAPPHRCLRRRVATRAARWPAGRHSGVNRTGMCLMPLMKSSAGARPAPASSMSGQPAQQLLEHDRGSPAAPGARRGRSARRCRTPRCSFGVRADVEAVGSGKTSSSRLADGVADDDLVALADLLPADLDVARAPCAGSASPATPSAASPRPPSAAARVGEQPRALLGMLDQRQHAAGDQVARGLVAGDRAAA